MQVMKMESVWGGGLWSEKASFMVFISSSTAHSVRWSLLE